MDFIIAGLPRSRTAWLSVFFSAGDVNCLHDPSAEYRIDNIPETAKINGMSDTGAVFYRDRLVELHPFAKWLIIERNIEECTESAVKRLKNHYSRPEIEAKMDFTKAVLDAIPDAMRIDFNKIDYNLKKIWDYCTGGEAPFDEQRSDILKKMNIRSEQCLRTQK